MEKIIIGTTTLNFDETGKAIGANFTPVLQTKAIPGDELLTQINAIDAGQSEEELKERAALVLGSWFLKVQEIEEADRDKFTIEGEVLNCDKWPSGIIRECRVEYWYKKVS